MCLAAANADAQSIEAPRRGCIHLALTKDDAHSKWGRERVACRAVKFFDVGLDAHGFVAIGQQATGFLAIGQLALGVIAIGQLARGIIAIGQVTAGVVAIGQVGLGIVYGAGMLGIGGTAGGLIPLAAFGRIPLRQVMIGRFDDLNISPVLKPWKVVLMAFIVLVVTPVVLIPLWDAVGGTVPAAL